MQEFYINAMNGNKCYFSKWFVTFILHYFHIKWRKSLNHSLLLLFYVNNVTSFKRKGSKKNIEHGKNVLKYTELKLNNWNLIK